MAESIRNNNIDAYTQFEKWLEEQPYWLQDAVYRIYHGLSIDDTQISKYADMCIAQAKKEKTEYKCLAKNESKQKSDCSKMAVNKLFDIKGVNALASDAELEFSKKGVNVIYGLNGAGKSGFMRIFKLLSGSPYEEPIQPNVFKKDREEKPSCKFLITEEETQREISCDLVSGQKDTPLVKCDVFDTRISNSYITKTNNVSYQPFVFTVLSELSDIADRINNHITERKNTIPDNTLAVPKEFSKRDDIEWINQLNHASTIPAQYACWTKQQQKDFEEIPKKLDTEKVTGELKLYDTLLGNVNPIVNNLILVNNAIKASELTQSHQAYVEAKNKRDLAEKLFAETADDLDKISASTAEWRDLWSVAKQYYESVIYKEETGHFGEEETICPLCHQMISGPTAERFKSVNEYVNGTCSEEFKKSETKLNAFLKSIFTKLISADQIQSLLSNILDESKISEIKAVYDSINAIEKQKDPDVKYAHIVKVKIDSALQILIDNKIEIEKKKEELEKLLQDEGRLALQKQFADLQYHKWVYDSKPVIETAISNLKKRQELSNANSYTKTNKITAEANQLAGVLITDAYIQRFTEELKKLAPKIKVKLKKAPSHKGSTPYQVLIDADSGINCKPEDILSEGEQRIVALAAFFADATGRETKTPLIIDDPISSLDLNYESSATKRIVALAETRQVIVFTHRISLLVGISEECDRTGVAFTEHHIRGTQKGKGCPDFEDVFRGKLKEQLDGIRRRIAEIKITDPDSHEYIDAVGRICQQFRICIERSVEEVLLLGMVRRFERRIMTNNKVTKLTQITPEDCNMVDNMMTKYSFTEHSQPTDSPDIEVDLADLDNDVEAFSAWIKQYNKRMN